jgi:phospholipid/cholesterol/gamma-HCH transport system ATP-binding protein
MVGTDDTKEAVDKDSIQYDTKVVVISHLHKSFGEHTVLKDISLEVAKGENLVIMGKSGTGKSVLIKCIVRLIDSDEGEIKVLDKDVNALKEQELNGLRKKIGFLFQSAALYDSMTVRENLEFPLRDSGKKQEEINTLVEESLQSVGLADVIEKMPAELSGGMRKRIGLARTLILRPELILYDEPNTGLDPITTREISKLIVELQHKYQTSSIIITHDAECARITGNRIMLINEGETVAEGTFNELQQSKDNWVRSFFNQTD